MTTNMDQTWHSPMFSIWSCVEMNVAIFCSCAPTLKGLIQRVWPKFLSTIGSRYASARGSGQGSSGREGSQVTAVNSKTSAAGSSNDSLHKANDISHVEAQSCEKPASGFLGFRRSLFKPFSKGTNHSLASCYGNTNNDDDIMFEDDSARLRKGSSTPSKMYEDDKGIEVQTTVDQYIEPRAPSRASRADEATKTSVHGAGSVAMSPFEDDEQEERDLQRAAWSS